MSLGIHIKNINAANFMKLLKALFRRIGLNPNTFFYDLLKKVGKKFWPNFQTYIDDNDDDDGPDPPS